MTITAWVLTAVVLALFAAAILIASRRRRRPADPTMGGLVPDDPARRPRVRVLPTEPCARDAKARALRQEIASLRREADYDTDRGLHQRARRLRDMASERERELERIEGVGTPHD